MKMNLNLKALIQEMLYIKKNRAYAIPLDEYESLRTRWIASSANGDNVASFVCLIM